MALLQAGHLRRSVHETRLQAPAAKRRVHIIAQGLLRELQLHVSSLPRADFHAPGRETIFQRPI